MPQEIDSTFDDANVVKYNGVRDDGCCEIICKQQFAQSIMDALNGAMIPCGLDPEEPMVADSAIIVTTTMANPESVPDHLKHFAAVVSPTGAGGGARPR